MRTWFRQVRAFPVGEVVLVMANISILEVLLWAFAYMALGEHKRTRSGILFFHGHIYHAGLRRYRSRSKAGDSSRLSRQPPGIIMFGWTTAILMTVVQYSYFGRKLDTQGP